ncbi:MAG: type III PLP-dependent enzyme [Aquificae bacterium]|nr:type III PLP-dependent enzyme [Aquificota bacterium]
MPYGDPVELQRRFAQKLMDDFSERDPEAARLLNEVSTPTLVMSKKILKERYAEVRRAFEGFNVYYAVKANDDEGVVETFASEGSGFEVASSSELEKVLRAGAGPERIISSNPVKPPEFVERCLEAGVDRFAVDSFAEVDKIARFRRRARVYVRLAVPNVGSDWPLSRKFGVGVDEAVEVLDYANRRGLVPYGITFHVGSQCNNLQNWFVAVKRAKEVWERAYRRGIKLQMLNAGGGIPARYTRESLSPTEIAAYLRGLLNKYFGIKTLELQIEPGRGLVAEAGVMVLSVIGRAERFGEKWIYVDAGVFHGLAEALGGIRYSFYSPKGHSSEYELFTIGGISCDSMDVVAEKVALPKDLEVGDRIFVLTAGAYTTVYASRFNGFEPPRVLLV